LCGEFQKELAATGLKKRHKVFAVHINSSVFTLSAIETALGVEFRRPIAGGDTDCNQLDQLIDRPGFAVALDPLTPSICF
jgi:hypothetical protein